MKRDTISQSYRKLKLVINEKVPMSYEKRRNVPKHFLEFL